MLTRMDHVALHVDDVASALRFYVEVLGFDSVPEAGEFVRVVENDRAARSLAQERATRLKLEMQARRSGKKASLETIFDQQRGALVSELNLVLKAEANGSLEALRGQVQKIDDPTVKIRIVGEGVGPIGESDVNLAGVSDAIVIGFNVKPDDRARAAAETQGVDVRFYDVVYQFTEAIRRAVKGL